MTRPRNPAPRNSLRERIEDAMEGRDIATYEELARAIGVHLQTFYRYRDETTRIPATKALRLAHILGMSVEDLLND